MKILVISWYFPPCNTMGALRVGKFVRYLLEQGHDVRVLCAHDHPYPQTLPVEVPVEVIHDTDWWDINFLPKAVQRLRVALSALKPGRGDTSDGDDGTDGKDPSTPSAAPSNGQADAKSGGDAAAPQKPNLLRRVLRGARNIYMTALNWPDPQIGWFWPALIEGKRLLKAWQPDIVFASAPPFTTLLIARRLARRAGVPWVAEYRDRWTEDPYGEAPPAWRHNLEIGQENRTLKSALAISTVSDPWAQDYRDRWGKPVDVIYNGFDANDFPAEYDRGETDPNILRIVYTGVLYPDRRDPRPLFRALHAMGDAANGVRVEFYGADPYTLEEMAAETGVSHLVSINGSVPYDQSVRLQMQADVLLLLQWNNPLERGNVPGKVFEYVAARRPVLGIGVEDGVPAKLMAERGVGVVINDPAAIAEKVQGWIDQKRAEGRIPLMPETVRDGLSRAEQYAMLESRLSQVLEGS